MSDLEKLSDIQQLMVGLHVCERMRISYTRFVGEEKAGDLRPLDQVLGQVRDVVATGGSMMSIDAELGQQCAEHVPDSEEFTSIYTSMAQEFAIAICCLCQFLSEPNVEHIRQIFDLAEDSIDTYILETERRLGNPSLAGVERATLRHPLMEQEMARRERDIESIGKCGAISLHRIDSPLDQQENILSLLP